jgi:hypothetical protein
VLPPGKYRIVLKTGREINKVLMLNFIDILFVENNSKLIGIAQNVNICYLYGMNFTLGLHKLVTILEKEEIPYMIVGGFAMSYYNRFRFTADIDCVLQIYPKHVEKIVKHFPEWVPSLSSMEDSAAQIHFFNLTDFSSGVKYDFMLYQDSDYNWTAFERREFVEFMGVSCYIATPEDLILSKLKWYEQSKSEKQLEDIKFLLKETSLDNSYLQLWSTRLNLSTHGLF